MLRKAIYYSMRILIFSLIVCCSGSGFSLSLQENGKWNLVDMGHLNDNMRPYTPAYGKDIYMF